MMEPSNLSVVADEGRRRFLLDSALAGGGLALGVPVSLPASAAQAAAGGAELNVWVVVRPDDICVVRFVRSEMGQGTLTGLAQRVAEELDCDWRKVTTEPITPGRNFASKRAWGEMGTGGSRGIRTSQDYVRRAGAAARLMLMQAAASHWGAPLSELTVDAGVIHHAASGRSIRYGQVAVAASALPAPDPKSVTLKDPRAWKIAGRPLHRLDTANKLDGSKVYAIDAATQLRALGVQADDVERIELRVHSLVLELTGKKAPQDGLEGKFSVYHGFAAGLVFGRAGEPEFADAIVRRADLTALRRCIVATVDDSIGEASIDATAILKNGRREHVFVEHAIGSLARPMTDAMLEAKFRDLAIPVIGPQRTNQLITACWSLGEAKDMKGFSALARPLAA